MDEPDSPDPQAPGASAAPNASAPALSPHPRNPNPRLPRKIAALFASSFVAFTLTTWFLSRVSNPADTPGSASTAEGVIREQLDALAQGKTRVAYAFFSPRYRSDVPFETFEAMVRAHGDMFRTTSIRKESEFESATRDEIKLRLDTASGDRFVARYTVVSIEGRWWIDEMNWRIETPGDGRTLALDLSAATAGACG